MGQVSGNRLVDRLGCRRRAHTHGSLRRKHPRKPRSFSDQGHGEVRGLRPGGPRPRDGPPGPEGAAPSPLRGERLRPLHPSPPEEVPGAGSACPGRRRTSGPRRGDRVEDTLGRKGPAGAAAARPALCATAACPVTGPQRPPPAVARRPRPWRGVLDGAGSPGGPCAAPLAARPPRGSGRVNLLPVTSRWPLVLWKKRGIWQWERLGRRPEPARAGLRGREPAGGERGPGGGGFPGRPARPAHRSQPSRVSAASQHS